MPLSDRLSYLEIGGAVAAVWLLAFTFGKMVTVSHLYSSEGAKREQQRTTEDHQAKIGLWAPAPFNKSQARPGEYQADCTSPKDREEADLCQQWRAAEAAEQAVAFAASQSFLNNLQAWATVAAAIFTFIAAWAAAVAARIAKKALVDIERPHVAVDITSNGVLVTPELSLRIKSDVSYRFRNFGRSPAQMVDLLIDAKVERSGTWPTPLARDASPTTTYPTGIIVASDAPYPETENLRSHIGFGGVVDEPQASRTHRIFLLMRYRYRDFTHTYTCGVCFMYDPASQRWVQRGDNQNYNYERRTPNPPTSAFAP